MSGQSAERPVLVWERSASSPVEFELGPGSRLTIGRDRGSAIVIDSPFVSKAHAVLEHRDGQYLVEDLGSANGTRVNGAPVKVYALGPGDVVEIGNQRLLFVDRASQRKAARSVTGRAAGAGSSKVVRLALAAVATMGVMGGLMLMLVRLGQPPAPAPIEREVASPPAAAAVARPVRPDSPLVRRIESQAAVAGVAPADALYDEGLAQLRGGRPREAAHLFAAAVRHDSRHAAARARLADAQTEWERAVADHMARADRAFGELRYEDAAREWEQVLQLAEAPDSRIETARRGIERVTQIRQNR